MPRKQFVADIQVTASLNIPSIGKIERGPDDDVLVSFIPASGPPIEITFMAQPDVASYPSESMFIAYTDSQGVSPAAAALIEDIYNISLGVRLPDLMTTVSQKLQRVFASGSREDPVTIDDGGGDTEMLDALGVDDDEQDSDEEGPEEYYSGNDDDDFGIESVRYGLNSHTNSALRLNPVTAAKIKTRIRNDLRSAKMAGFKVGVITGMEAESVSSILSLSIRIAKLGISEEALQAWDLEPRQYLMLLIRYSDGYKSFDDITANSAKLPDVSFRVGVGNKYKCTLLEALAAFSDATKDMSKPPRGEAHGATGEVKKNVAGFSNIFISSSLNQFTNTQFITLLKIRASIAVGWEGAKRYFNDKQGHLEGGNEDLPAVYFEESDGMKDNMLPNRIAIDHLTDLQAKDISFPFIAMQFTLRYLTRCTQFCLVCHDKIENVFEALKPYVCENPLCLYQYMSLGFGPSVEHEIMTQPYVVDLLVSFCHSSALALRLRDYPTGMSLSVPPTTITAPVTTAALVGLGSHQKFEDTNRSRNAFKDPATVSMEVRFDHSRHEVICDDLETSPVHTGAWVIITAANGFAAEHYRVEDVSFFPVIRLSSTPISRRGPDLSAQSADKIVPLPATAAMTPPPSSLSPAIMTIYRHNFDDLNDASKSYTIVMLIETLPSIRDMRAYLVQQSHNTEPSLKAWKERISPAALGLLRWIIASNRSCIVQVDRCPGQSDIELAISKTRLDQRVSDIEPNWVQFRFAQGSPDKEQRFLNALRAQKPNLNAKYPTIFAWHGSPLANWHSIIRTGLDFKETLHGRAFGHGVYHAMDQATSIGYAQVTPGSVWEGSELKIRSAMSLNEIVNCPKQFTSSSPYLVVQHVDWIQCRYLFVQTTGDRLVGPPIGLNSEWNTRREVEQDPTRVTKSTLGKPVGIPICAASISRAFHVDAADTPAKKKRKHNFIKIKKNESLIESDGENASDLDLMRSDDELFAIKDRGKGLVVLNSKQPANPLTDFIADSLDQHTLPMLQPPMYATPMASNALNRNLQELLAIQKKTPLHELGWYINPDLISNIYQWIVELHSFDASLPLAKDMKLAGVTSIVLEIRFGKDYPFSPPFVRVIRPRFLPFAAGGGGHVTAGGAMCMELLTNTGWTAVSTIESVLLQVRVEMMSQDRPARLETTGKQMQRDYGTAEAIDAYERSCKTHGWAIPPGFRDFANPSV
ncbi:uncharacterized protein L3040_008100 [Drepanopeziza brunnea f. sp. 'multigermtubi']|uniref:Putative ubiquitin-conjugating enzyme n=1 Tax=Marssonina brunnea f. sp. multigermtubi (strain MB_m1) TaxID=1072389 RepID=K1WJA0_MARBU|nr:putative ubiquitin-conjugating enzyme [Drepanopeziza brunnea f. sp. 'multigermtubi' MB_m1]EKD17715.1 putative ubiquitin-conjugating enzyme [Drepanopeziza brunnea f. sp. 'multigermtubi' MB_m1]KAJ5035635.1 hypothetical protein L3040_008100 [Drepanopeziza brunnea f. sp. 'multigermtubi']